MAFILPTVGVSMAKISKKELKTNKKVESTGDAELYKKKPSG